LILWKSSIPSIFGILMSKRSNWYKPLLKFCNAIMGSIYESTSKSFSSSPLLTRYTISSSSSTSNILSFALILLVVRHFRCLIVYMYYKYCKSVGRDQKFCLFYIIIFEFIIYIFCLIIFLFSFLLFH
jgi:hypothetical protein